MTDAFKRSMRMAAGAAVVVLLTACGQKGPLYLPDANGEVVTRPTQSSQPPGESPRSPQQQPSPVDSEKEATRQPR
jgi:predicted small lipoprotein YifL